MAKENLRTSKKCSHILNYFFRPLSNMKLLLTRYGIAFGRYYLCLVGFSDINIAFIELLNIRWEPV